MHRRLAYRGKNARRRQRVFRAVFPVNGSCCLDVEALIAETGYCLRLYSALVVAVCVVAEFLLRLSTAAHILASLPLVPSALLAGVSFSMIQSRLGLGALITAISLSH